MSLLVVGSVALDSIQTPLGKKKDLLGGSATYASLAARLFARPRLVGVVGKDFPKQHAKLLKSKGIDLAGLTHAKGKTFRWDGRYEYDMNVAHTDHVALNVFQTFAPSLPKGWSSTRSAFLGNIDPELQLRVRKQLKKPRLTAVDSMNFWIEGKRKALLKVLKTVDMLFLNDAEARQLTGESHLGVVARDLIRMGPLAVVIKKGEHGALLATERELFALPGFVVDDVHDPTGAGDSFAGGMVGYLAGQTRCTWRTLKRGLIYGSAMASMTIESFGTRQLAGATRASLDRRVRAYQRLNRWD